MPVLGYDTAGVQNWGSNGLKMGSNDNTDVNGGNIQKFHIAIAGSISPAWVKMAVYNCDQGGGSPFPYSLVEQVELEVNPGDDEWIIAPTGENLSGDTKYFLAFHVQSSNTKVKFDGGGSGWYSSGVYANSFEAVWPLTCTFIARLNSVWVDYEPAEEGALLPILSGDAIHSAEDLIVR